MDILAHLIGGILGIDLGVIFVIPVLLLEFGTGLAAAGKILESILG